MKYTAILASITEIKLSPAEHKVALLVLQGFERKEIAEKLYLSSGTVATHTGNIYYKCGVRNQPQMVAKALKSSMRFSIRNSLKRSIAKTKAKVAA